MPTLIAFIIILLISSPLLATEKLERFKQEICSSNHSQVLFYDRLVYTIKKTKKSKTFNPLGYLGQKRVEINEIWQSSAPPEEYSEEQYFFNKGYSLLKHNTGLYLVQGQTAVIPKTKCKFLDNKSHFQPWSCSAKLNDQSNKIVTVKIKANRKKIDLQMNRTHVHFKNPAILKAGITAKADISTMVWFNTNNVYITVGSLSKFKKCKKAKDSDYPAYITEQIIRSNES